MNFKSRATMREMLNQIEEPPGDSSVPDQYGRNQGLVAVEQALATEPTPIPNNSDGVVKSYLEMGENIAKSLEDWGDFCEKKGQDRKKECYAAAAATRKKAEYHAREAGEFIDKSIQLKALSENRPILNPPTLQPVDPVVQSIDPKEPI